MGRFSPYPERDFAVKRQGFFSARTFTVMIKTKRAKFSRVLLKLSGEALGDE